MHSFKDFKGEQWDIELVRSSLRTIKARTGIDLLCIYEVDAENQLKNMEQVLGDEDKLIEILTVACATQIVERKLTPVEFGDRLKAESLDDAADALAREGASFFPTQRRLAIISVLDTAKAVAQNLENMLSANFDVRGEAERISQLLFASLDSTTKTTTETTLVVEPSTNSAGGSPDASTASSTLTDTAFLNSADFTPPPTDNAGTTQPRS